MLAGCDTLGLGGHAAAPSSPSPAAMPAPVAAPQPAVPIPASKPPVPASIGRVMNDARGVPVVLGLDRDALIRQFGTPAAEREASPARVLEFRHQNCHLAAYLYFDTARNDFYALQYEVNGSVEHNEAADRCLIRIARDAARS